LSCWPSGTVSHYLKFGKSWLEASARHSCHFMSPIPRVTAPNSRISSRAISALTSRCCGLMWVLWVQVYGQHTDSRASGTTDVTANSALELRAGSINAIQSPWRIACLIGSKLPRDGSPMWRTSASSTVHRSGECPMHPQEIGRDFHDWGRFPSTADAAVLGGVSWSEDKGTLAHRGQARLPIAPLSCALANGLPSCARIEVPANNALYFASRCPTRLPIAETPQRASIVRAFDR